MTQRQEKSTPFKPHPLPHITGTKRSLYRDLEKQFLASRHISDADVAGSSISQENADPISQSRHCEPVASAKNDVIEPISVKSGQVSVIRRAPSAVRDSDASEPKTWVRCLAEISDNRLPSGSFASSDKPPHKEAEHDEARYVSALALIELAQGHL